MAAVARAVRQGLAGSATKVTQCGACLGTKTWALYFQDAASEQRISPWHDLRGELDSGVLQVVNEIPRGTRAKMEVSTKDPGNPIKQDLKNGQLRYYAYGDMPFNYGCLPQTWEDPNVAVAECGGSVGDNDPLDVVDLSNGVFEIGEVVPSRPLGVLALIDEGETDWKVLTVPDTEEFARFQSLADLQRDDEFNKKLAQAVHWFRYYKTVGGNPENSFGFNGEVQDEQYALRVIEEARKQYDALREGKAESKGLWLPDSSSQA
eukprot:TRINITY_DN75177_c0_g1_i1.p1 TRINITY_DN75177_c0_g1~~TRINITY_DN75177_c0_g1_i1.p1  ORF type:complete len:282 (+),score=86.63 TRINITY_DN75177_c0_g1_i1:58-846(+)